MHLIRASQSVAVRLGMMVLVYTILASPARAQQTPRIEVSPDQSGFILAEGETKTSFTPWGFNYDHDNDGRLLEDYWFDEWETIAGDFREMKQLGANLVRIHLQFGKFMNSADEADQRQLDQLAKLLALAQETGLYIDLTGLGCYHKQDVPAWYDALSEEDRWAAQASFWEAVARTCAEHPALFCYDLMNEPVVPAGKNKRDNWLTEQSFGGKHFVQFIGLDLKGRDRPAVAREWIRTLKAAIRKHDQRTLITVGLMPNSLDRPGLTTGFVPDEIVDELDFICVHLYPRKDEIEKALDTLRGFNVGKPVVIEETFPLYCGFEQYEQFFKQAQPHAAGWVSFYWGATPDELAEKGTLQAAILRQWLLWFRDNKVEAER